MQDDKKPGQTLFLKKGYLFPLEYVIIKNLSKPFKTKDGGTDYEELYIGVNKNGQIEPDEFLKPQNEVVESLKVDLPHE